MKKFVILILTLAFSMASFAQKVTQEQALQKAKNFFKDKGIVSNNPRRAASAAQQSDANHEDFYVFNAENKGGFVIISGDERTPEVLGYADSGSLDMNNLPPNLKGWLEEYSKQIKAIESSGITIRRAIESGKRTSKPTIEPLITTKWGQGSPYNNQCPEIDGKHCVTGCVATAMAQVMYYHKWPQDACATIPAYTTSTRQIEMPALSPTTFNWNAMKSKYWEGETGESADAVAELMRYCGQAVEMNYTIDESGAFEMPRHLIQYFGYSKNAKYVTMSQYTESQWEDIIYKELSEGRPMLYGGANLTSAHEFICDGYDGDGYYHFNWGWNGDANGYYLLSILYRTMYCGYVNGQTAIIGLQPEKGEIARPYVYGYNGGELTQTNYSRSSTSDNFTNITLNGGIYIQYEVDVTQDVIIDYGLGLYRGDQLLSVLNQSTATLNLDKPAVANEMSFSFGGDLGDGTYQIRHIYKYPNSEIWQTCYDAYLNYIVATISGTTMTLRNAISPDMQEADYIVNDVSFDPGIFNDNITMVTVNLTNTGDTNQELIYFWVRSGENSQGYDLICGFIPPGETGNVVFPTDLHEKGEITMCISSKINRENVRWEKVITMPEYQECKLSCTDYSIKNFNNGILKDSKLQVTLTIKNTGDKNFNGPISYILAEFIDDTKTLTEVVRQLQTITLNKGESTTFDAVIPHLENNTWYQFGLFCGAAGGEVIYFPDCFNLDFFAAIHSCSYEGLNYVYEPGAKTASVITGDYHQIEAITIPSIISIEGQSYKVTEIAPKAFNNCHFQSVVLPEGIELIRSYAFQLCRMETINFPSSLKHISDYAFYCSSGIKEIALPEGLVSIGPEAFRECRDLEVLRFPSSLKSINNRIIWGSNNLAKVYSDMPEPIEVPEEAFTTSEIVNGVYQPKAQSAILCVPKGCVEKYRAAPGWNVFTRITDKQSYKLTYVVDGEIYKTYDLEEETGITPEPAPTKEGYTFSGWSEIPEKMPAHDVTVTGTFTINKYKLTYKVDGAEYKSYDVEYGATITPEPAPTKEGYNFSGWSEIPATMPAHDVTVTGTFTIVDPVTITAKSYSRKYGEENPTFEYTSEGATLTGTPEITCEATVTSPVGEYAIVISKGTVTNYNDHYVNGVLTITKAPLTITAKNYSIKQGESLPKFEAEYGGFKNNETDAVLTKKPTITTTATSASEPGIYDIVVSGAEATNYEISYVKGTLTISAVEVEPVTETETTTFSETVNENTDLSNTIIDNTYFTMNAENGDGYDATEQAIVLNSTTTAEQMNAIQNAQVGDATMQANYNGIIFEVPAGNGTITVEAKTIGSHVLNVQIGNGEPTKITKSERGTVDVPYNVTVPTYVYLYASTSGSSSAPKRAAAANSLLLYSYKVTVIVNGIQVVTYSDLENAKWYTLDGLQLQGKPTKKGLYIVNGRQVIVK